MNKERKEYNDRWNAPLVNPGITYGEYEANRERELAAVAAFNYERDMPSRYKDVD